MAGTGNLSTTANESYNFGGLTIGGTTAKFLTNDIQKFDDTLPAGLTDHTVAFIGSPGDSVAHAIEADQDMTVKTYDGVTLVDTLTLKAASSMNWNQNKLAALKVFTGDFDSIKVTTSTKATRLKIGIALNVAD